MMAYAICITVALIAALVALYRERRLRTHRNVRDYASVPRPHGRGIL